MAFRLPDKWVWDFWLARAGDEHHLFYLQAPRSLGRPSLRHHNATVGHAVSSDLATWEVVQDALGPGPAGSWDDLAIWTGSVIEHEGGWRMLYTGVGAAEGGLVQRVGLATSDDLVRWEKHPANPVLEADSRWYDLLDLGRWRDQSWRDPWLFRCDGDPHVHVLLTARSRVGEADAAGVVAHARSLDFVEWEVLPPVTAAGDFAQAEVPQLLRMNGRYELIVSCLAEDHSRERRERLGAAGETGTFVYAADDPLGPFTAVRGPIARPDGPLGTLYAGKLVEAAPGDWRFLAFRGDGDRAFLGELTDPLPVRLEDDGRIVVEVPSTELEGAR